MHELALDPSLTLPGPWAPPWEVTHEPSSSTEPGDVAWKPKNKEASVTYQYEPEKEVLNDFANFKQSPWTWTLPWKRIKYYINKLINRLLTSFLTYSQGIAVCSVVCKRTQGTNKTTSPPHPPSCTPVKTAGYFLVAYLISTHLVNVPMLTLYNPSMPSTEDFVFLCFTHKEQCVVSSVVGGTCSERVEGGKHWTA